MARTAVGFFYTGPTVWNSLLDKLRNSDSSDSFKRFLKTLFFFSAAASVTSALRYTNEIR